MTTNKFIVGQRAAKLDDLAVTFARIDAQRWQWAAERFASLDAPAGAARAREFAREYSALADQLAAEVQYGTPDAPAGNRSHNQAVVERYRAGGAA